MTKRLEQQLSAVEIMRLEVIRSHLALNQQQQTMSAVRKKEIALRERPDVLAALADCEAAQSAMQLEIANQYPDIQANPGHAWNLGEQRWTLGAILPVPVFHHNQGLIAEAEAARLLGIHRSQLYDKSKELGIAPEEGPPLPENGSTLRFRCL